MRQYIHTHEWELTMIGLVIAFVAVVVLGVVAFMASGGAA